METLVIKDNNDNTAVEEKLKETVEDVKEVTESVDELEDKVESVEETVEEVQQSLEEAIVEEGQIWEQINQKLQTILGLLAEMESKMPKLKEESEPEPPTPALPEAEPEPINLSEPEPVEAVRKERNPLAKFLLG